MTCKAVQVDQEAGITSPEDQKLKDTEEASTSRQQDGAEPGNEGEGEAEGAEPSQAKLHEDLPPAVVAIVATRDG